MSPIKFEFDPINVDGITSAKLWVQGGSSSDPPNQRGANQLLASLLTRGCGPYNHIELANLIENAGAILRTETYEDGILISLKCRDYQAHNLITILGWMLVDPHLEKKQINLEKDLTINALKRQNENPFHLAYDRWRSLVYKTGPYAHDPLGEENDLKGLTQQNLVHLSRSLQKQLKFIAISGRKDKNLEDKINSTDSFKRIIETSNQTIIVPDFNQDKSGGVICQEIEIEQVIIILGQATIAYNHQDELALRLLCCYLGSGMSSLLFRELREDNGVAYEVGAYHPPRKFKAPFLIHASTSVDKALLTLKLLQKIWMKFLSNQISEMELKLVRSKFIGQISHNIQTSSQRAERIVYLKNYNLPIDYDKNSMNQIYLIDSKKIQEVAIKYLKNPFLSLCGQKDIIKKLKIYWENS